MRVNFYNKNVIWGNLQLKKNEINFVHIAIWHVLSSYAAMLSIKKWERFAKVINL